MRTYSHDGRIIGHGRRLVLLGRLYHRQLLHVTTAKDDVLVDLVRAGLLLGRVGGAAFSAVGGDILEGDGGGLAVDFVQGADILDVGL